MKKNTITYYRVQKLCKDGKWRVWPGFPNYFNVNERVASLKDAKELFKNNIRMNGLVTGKFRLVRYIEVITREIDVVEVGKPVTIRSRRKKKI